MPFFPSKSEELRWLTPCKVTVAVIDSRYRAKLQVCSLGPEFPNLCTPTLGRVWLAPEIFFSKKDEYMHGVLNKVYFQNFFIDVCNFSR